MVMGKQVLFYVVFFRFEATDNIVFRPINLKQSNNKRNKNMNYSTNSIE